MRLKRMIRSFNFAISGIIQALKTEPNMKIHFIIAFLVLFASLLLNFSRVEMVILLLTVGMVITAEMINTALEKTIDLITDDYQPLAKLVKDVAAGAVLVTAVIAVVVAYLLFFDRIGHYPLKVLNGIKNSNIHLTFISLGLIVIIVIWIKTVTKTGTPLQGGFASGHSALGFSLATAISFITQDSLAAILAYIMAFIIAESRIESKIHLLRETIIGGILGIIVTVLVFKIIG